MTTATALTADDESEITRLYGAGLASAKIMRRFHIDAPRLYGILGAQGIQKRSRGDTIRTTLTPQQKVELVEAYGAGTSLEQLRITYRTARRVVKQIIITAGLAITGQGRKPGKDRKAVVTSGVERLHCPRCKEMKPRDAFNKCSRSRCGASSYCKECQTLYGKGVLYGITPQQYQAMLEHQGGCCAICGGAGMLDRRSPLAVDHNHTTGRVRELLCLQCNTMVGHSKENVVTLRKAIEYLNKHAAQ